MGVIISFQEETPPYHSPAHAPEPEKEPVSQSQTQSSGQTAIALYDYQAGMCIPNLKLVIYICKIH